MNGTKTNAYDRALRLALLGVTLLTLPRIGLAQRHVARLHAVALQTGQTEQNGHYLTAGYGQFITDCTRLDVGVAREWSGRQGDSGKFTAYGLNLGISRVLFRLGEAFYVHGTTALTNRYERVQPGNAGATDQGSILEQYSFGPLLGLDADLYLANRISLCGSVTKGYLFLSPALTTWPGTYGVGLRYHFR